MNPQIESNNYCFLCLGCILIPGIEVAFATATLINNYT
jgi:hypothetical protein